MEQAADAFQRAEEREERERLAAELSQVSAQVQKLSSDRNHLQWCLEKERAQVSVCGVCMNMAARRLSAVCSDSECKYGHACMHCCSGRSQKRLCGSTSSRTRLNSIIQ